MLKDWTNTELCLVVAQANCKRILEVGICVFNSNTLLETWPWAISLN